MIALFSLTHQFIWLILFVLLFRREIAKISQACFLKAINLAMFFVASKIILFVCFITYVFLGGKLSADIVFVTTMLFNILRINVTRFFPQAIAATAEALVTCKRIQVWNFFLCFHVFMLFVNLQCVLWRGQCYGTFIIANGPGDYLSTPNDDPMALEFCLREFRSNSLMFRIKSLFQCASQCNLKLFHHRHLINR